MTPPTDSRRGADYPVSVAPMMDTTDRFCRVFLRLLSKRTLLYTEMIPVTTLIHGDRERALGWDREFEQPCALQLGGDDPAQVAECARIGVDYGYDEINLNVGCPSSRVKEGCFGASLMARPEVVARCVEAMRAAVEVPVTVKHRIGIDDIDRYEDMERFVRIVAEAGADRFTVHARKAWLSGLSPKENRTIPPLRYEEVYRLKREFPQLYVEINGGISGPEAVARHLEHVDAVMIGRGVVNDPYQLAGFDQRFYPDRPAPPPPSRTEAARALLPWLARWRALGAGWQILLRGPLNLFAGVPGARRWRQALSVGVRQDGLAAVERAIAAMEERSQPC